jgi:indole-3-glycerol phosphate synthase
MSVSKRARRRGKILDEIMAYHRKQLPGKMREVPLEDIRAFSVVAPQPLDFYGALKKPGVSLIAECKKASPSKGLISRDYDAVGLAKAYAQGGASAISILTDARHFQGSLEDLRDVKDDLVQIPLLRKDFIFDPYQIYESRAAGADAILLIASVLDGSVLADLFALSGELGMEALIEVHNEIELKTVLDLEPRIIGINNRNLQTFEVDFENTGRLRNLIPDEIVVVGESGVRSDDDIRKLKQMGVDAVLVGETLVRSRQPVELVKSFVSAGL